MKLVCSHVHSFTPPQLSFQKGGHQLDVYVVLAVACLYWFLYEQTEKKN